MELNYLRIFYEVAKLGKFSEAAKRLNISQSALSRSVNLLEEQEGVILFDRSKKGVSLTAKGIGVFKLCDKLFQTEKEIKNLCHGLQDKCEGRLVFAASDHIVNDFLLKPLHNFCQKYEKIIPCIYTGSPNEIVNNLQTTDCEFALMFAKINTPQIEYKRLHAEVMSLVCTPRLWKECKSSSNEKTLKKLISKYGYISSIGASLENRPSRVLTELFGEIPKFSFEINNQESQKRICLAGGGVAYLSRFMVKKEISSGELFEIPLDHVHEFHLWLAYPKGKNLSFNAKTFLKHLMPNLET